MYKFFAFLNRMKYISRWSLMRSTVRENIMEHSQQVAVVAHALATISNTYFGGNLDANSIAVKALFHETSEVLTGDLPTPIKYFNPEIRDAYKALEQYSNDKLLKLLPTEMVEVYTNIVNDNESIEHKFVKYADKICAYIKCIDEVKMSNSEFFKAEKTIRAEIDAIDSPEVKFFMENFVDAFYLTLDELEG
ncbi:MAG: 5'-deoxynucleotidase [Clostridia bacterium]|nr:5'-deoxynucleotidase [Clostridia bacterium]MBQ7914527.1 5'-deoxynucleotidase [Clostridia bacterium]MBQ8505585.1 5'-deoxynucleotidase [Clostridia bacterium]MBQ8772846.1 5'-deoxynucleotidase [Clostridia bacterium]MBQ8873523.1 5'-deoxynucleotidase [Clostridia bacterium]